MDIVERINLNQDVRGIDVLLTQPGHIQDEKVPYLGRELPLGLAYLASYLESQGLSAEIFDMNIYEGSFELLKKILKETKPLVVGVSAFTVDIIRAGDIARAVKEFDKNITTVIGGIHATALPEQTMLEFEYFDYLIYGRGELSLASLVKNLKSGKNPRVLEGLVYRSDGNVIKNPPQRNILPLDELPYPARSRLNLKKYAPHIQKCFTLPNTGLISSLGCPYRCVYCSIHIVHPDIYSRNPENVVKELKYCVDNFGISDFRFFDDCLTLNRARMVKLCELIIKEGLKIHWNGVSRVDRVDYQLLKLMKKAGCHQLGYGIEVGSERGLKIINKKTTLKQAQDAIYFTKKAGLETSASFIFGFPGETIGDMRKTIDFAKKLSPDIALFYIVKAYPATALYENLKKENAPVHTRWDQYLVQAPPVTGTGISGEILVGLLREAYRSFYFRPRYILQRIKRMLEHPKREFKVSLLGMKMVAAYFRNK
ncbi:MAG: radical SAM protein [Candidatus Omnitrophica bacterium]|nr:radical SAM protein [Candidatus Omnitrophota bacterium]